ncbi:thioredoxin domain-containing protein 2 isoform X3 [Tamandua tetradactyla]|uniref:thioredoxin domain-containing protein 2 isoform X3 n=1 Tax=Tamandua tetradactyla TaxID=48850 RepID=UPI0040546D80
MENGEIGALEEQEEKLDNQEETYEGDSKGSPLQFCSSNTVLLVPELSDQIQVQKKAVVPEIPELPAKETIIPQPTDMLQSKEGGIPKPSGLRIQPREGDVSKPSEKNIWTRESNSPKPSEKTIQPKEGDVLKPSELATHTEEGDVLKPSEQTIKPKEGDAPKPSEKTIQPKEGAILKPSEQTTQPEEGDVLKPSEQTTQPEEGDVLKPSEQTTQPEEGDVLKPSEQTTQPEEGDILKPSVQTTQPAEGDVLQLTKLTMEPLEGDRVKGIQGKEDFEAALKEAGERLVAVDFSATWCGPCETIKPLFHTLSVKYDDVVFLEVDADECEELIKDCEIFCIPTFQFYKKEEKVGEICGAIKDKLEAAITELK